MIGRERQIGTFRRRLTWSMALLCVGCLLGAEALVFIGTWQALRSNLDNALMSIAHAESASMTDRPDGAVHIHNAGTLASDAENGPGYEHFVQIKDTDLRVLAQTSNVTIRTDFPQDAVLERRALSGQSFFADIYNASDRYRAVYYPIDTSAQGRVVVVVAVATKPLVRSLETLLVTLVGSLIIGSAAAVWGASRLSGYLTRPLERVAGAARSIDESNLGARIPEVSADRELRELSDILNDMLGRLETAFHLQQRMVELQKRFMADASHEVRTPLANMRGTVEVTLRRPRPAEEYRKALETLLPEILRLSSLVSDLLTLSRVEGGHLAESFTLCNLAEIAHVVTASFSTRAAAKKVALRVEVHEPVFVWGSRGQLQQVVTNLLDNAIRHTPAESEVVVAVRQVSRGAELSVCDAGSGLSPEDRDRIFDRFYRVDGARTREAGGVGLGLAIVKAIIEAHGGEVRVVSEPGSGATFSVYLPEPSKRVSNSVFSPSIRTDSLDPIIDRSSTK
jgi:two-component system OmpR family sensor kinase